MQFLSFGIVAYFLGQPVHAHNFADEP